MYLYSYPSTHAISGLAAGGYTPRPWSYTPRHSVHLRHPCISVQPPSLLEDVPDRACLRCTWRRRSSELRDALGGHDWASLDMHLETEIEWTQRCTWRPWSSEFGDALGGQNRASLELCHLEAMIVLTWRPWSSEIGRVLGGGRWTAHPVMRLYSSVS